jgi:hypothetical protein
MMLYISVFAQTVNAIRKLVHRKYQSTRTAPTFTDDQIRKRLPFCDANFHGAIGWGGDHAASVESRWQARAAKNGPLARAVLHQKVARGHNPFSFSGSPVPLNQ